MTYFEIIEFITLYGVDVAVLGVVTSLLTQILKTTLLKKAPNKIYTFLPFALGTVLYFFYAAASHASFLYAAENFALVMERGVSVGAAATMVYVIYEQFIRGNCPDAGIAELAVKALLKDFLKEDKLDDVAKKIVCEFDGTDLVLAEQTVEKYISEAAGEVSAADLKYISGLVVKMLAGIKTFKAE